ncbi:hypothetical protein FM101_04810 [Arthrobacter rhombi]|uniref:Uncharacterized protein n=1 Tax=Arthrobacter rhombi TaxID=71253 RepID=A0A1R4FMM8_9MICC|nr:hypothetical protein FM101_04810 [Arthrobacter rhombi]
MEINAKWPDSNGAWRLLNRAAFDRGKMHPQGTKPAAPVPGSTPGPAVIRR